MAKALKEDTIKLTKNLFYKAEVAVKVYDAKSRDSHWDWPQLEDLTGRTYTWAHRTAYGLSSEQATARVKKKARSIVDRDISNQQKRKARLDAIEYLPFDRDELIN